MAGIEDITDDDLGNGLDTEEVKIADKESDSNPSEDNTAEEQAAIKATADKEAADKLAAEKLVEEQEAEKKGFVPKGRFNEVNEEKKSAIEEAAAAKAENKRLNEEIEALKSGNVRPREPAVDPRDLLEDKIVDLQLISQSVLVDYGIDSEEYKDSLKAVNKVTRELSALEAEMRANQAVIGLKGENAEQARIKAELESVGRAAFEVYPFLDVNGDQADDQAIADVLEYRNDLIAAGQHQGKALQKAIDKFAPLHAARINAAKPPNDDDLAKARAVKEAREKAAKEKAATASRQPSIPSGRVVDDNFKPEVDKLTPKEVGEMSEEQLAVLLGNA